MADRIELRRHPEAADLVARRAALLAALRAELVGRGLVEVDVPVLLPFAGQEPCLQPPAVDVPGLGDRLWLQTSPELPLKRLLCAGVPALFALGPSFRGGAEELSAHHQPAFTMLEWYRPGDRIEELVADCLALGASAARALGVRAPEPHQLLTVREACTRWAGLDLAPLLHGDGPAFAASARRAGLSCRDDDDAATLLGRVLVERIEPALRDERGWVFLHGYPASLAALARLSSDVPPVALRVEAYLRGIELANGYVELTDGRELARRWAAEAAARTVGDPPPRDEALLRELDNAGVPDTVGMALGVDRLVMALLDATTLADVMPLHLARTDADATPLTRSR